jgi:hypothetical protein
MASFRSILKNPVPLETRRLLEQRWTRLPEDLRTEKQVVGQHWVQCGYTTGPSYCSFGCSHCYLPGTANKLPMPDLTEMKTQIRENRRMLGPGGNIQITGGDLVDAYLKADRGDELVEVVRYADEQGLVPMLMTHGQALLENPDYLRRLVTEGRLRKISIHIDITQAGRHGYPRNKLSRESDLHPLRDAFRDLILDVSRQTGKRMVGAQTVTVTERNIDSIADIFEWLIADRNNSRVFRTISFQTEAATGRTLLSENRVDEQRTWEEICRGAGIRLSRDTLHFGHPDCSSLSMLLVDPARKRFIDLMPATDYSQSFWSYMVANLGGAGGRSPSTLDSWIRKLSLLLHHPSCLLKGARYITHLAQDTRNPWKLQPGYLRGEIGYVKIVMHNFIDDALLREPRSRAIQQRLDACSFRGAHRVDGEWQAVPMCLMNADYRGDTPL